MSEEEKEVKGKSSKGLFEKIGPILLVVSLILAFGVGVLWQKVSSLEKKGSNPTASGAGNVEAPLSVNNLKNMAKDLKLNTKDFDKCIDDGKYTQKVKDELAYGVKVGVQGTPAFFINGKFLGGAYPYESFKEIIDRELADTGSKNYKDYSDLLQKAYSVDNPEARSFDPTPKEVEIGTSPLTGDQNAKVTIVEFSDFECPYCARHFTQTYPELKTNYIDEGSVRLVFKNYPLAFHQTAQKAAEAAECANEQGKFWEMHDKMFQASAAASQ